MTNEKLQPLPFQRDLIEWISDRRECVVWADMGTGKTFTSIWSVQALEAGRIIVAAPAAMTGTWETEIRRIEPDAKILLVDGKTRELGDARWVICSYDLPTSNNAVSDMLRAAEADAVILDECHYLKSADSARTAIWATGRDAIAAQAPIKIALSGTLMPNHIGEAWPILKLLRATSMEWEEWHETFCTHKMMSLPNGDQVRKIKGTNTAPSRINMMTKILGSVARRVRKADVLPDLPEKSRRVIPVGVRALKGAELQQFEDSTDGRRLAEAVELGDLRSVDPVAMARYQKLLAAMKAEAAVRYAETIVEGGADAVLIWFWHRAAMDIAAKAMGKRDYVRIDGQTPASQRPGIVARFQEEGGPQYALLQIKAAGVGLTMTRASHSVHAEFSWSPADNAQAEDRIHRIGQHRPCVHDYLAVRGSMDEVILRVLHRKQEELAALGSE